MRAFILAALALLATPVAAETPDQVARRYALAGEVLVARGDTVLLDRGYGPIDPAGGKKHRAGERWRLASITKQVVATRIVQQLSARGVEPIGLDADMTRALDMPRLGTVTLRQLLTHHSGLPNPDETPPTGGVPGFYRKPSADLDYCTARPAAPSEAFRYNNCDYILAGRVLIGGYDDWSGLWPEGLTMAQGGAQGGAQAGARAGERGVPGFVGGKPEPVFELASWGAAGGLIGTARALFAFDRDLMTGKLLPPSALAELWKPEGHGSYQALGQWVFPGKLQGCAAAKRIVQRDGEIYGVQARNFILPDDDLVVIVFTNRSSDDFQFGEVWQGKGFAYDLLSAAVGC